ncbi:hypothetical protein [Natronomonas sp.]|uniref:hypothetical protein n=1 Tax=Natronomonas sp. TaxID=2184060 RepID=UPI002FC39CE0
MRRLVPDRYDDDAVFATADRVSHDAEADRWTLRIDPGEGLVGAPVGTPISDVQARRPTRTEDDDLTVLEGPVLFSAGVVTLVDGDFVLLYRDADASTDPERWTSPAGRGDHDPGTTALKEFYEELVILDGDTPVFVTVDDRSVALEEVYTAALRGIGNTTPPSEWDRVSASTPDRYRPYLSTVVTEVDGERFTDEMLAYYDAEANTLELRFVIALDLPNGRAEALSFADGEFDREVRRFTRSEYVALERADLVPTDAYMAHEIESPDE